MNEWLMSMTGIHRMTCVLSKPSTSHRLSPRQKHLISKRTRTALATMQMEWRGHLQTSRFESFDIARSIPFSEHDSWSPVRILNQETHLQSLPHSQKLTHRAEHRPTLRSLQILLLCSLVKMTQWNKRRVSREPLSRRDRQGDQKNAKGRSPQGRAGRWDTMRISYRWMKQALLHAGFFHMRIDQHRGATSDMCVWGNILGVIPNESPGQKKCLHLGQLGNSFREFSCQSSYFWMWVVPSIIIFSFVPCIEWWDYVSSSLDGCHSFLRLQYHSLFGRLLRWRLCLAMTRVKSSLWFLGHWCTSKWLLHLQYRPVGNSSLSRYPKGIEPPSRRHSERIHQDLTEELNNARAMEERSREVGVSVKLGTRN